MSTPKRKNRQAGDHRGGHRMEVEKWGLVLCLVREWAQSKNWKLPTYVVKRTED